MTIRERQPDWRMSLIDDFIASGTYLPKSLTHDTMLREGIKFRKAFQKCSASQYPSIAVFKLEKDYADMMMAHEVATNGSMERFFLEALIVSNSPVSDIAKKTGFTKKTVECFESLYFDVRKNLDKPVYIMSVILGPLFEYTTKVHHDHLWKAVGFFCGIDALEALWNLGNTSRAATEKISQLLRNRLLGEAAVASFSRKPGASNASYVLESYINAGHLDIARDTADADNDLTETTDDYLSSIHESIVSNMKLSLKNSSTEHGRSERSTSNPERDVDAKLTRPIAFGGTEVKEDIDEEAKP